MIIKKDILVLDKDPIQGLDNTTITAEAEYFINLWKEKFIIEATVFHSLKPQRIYQFKVKDSEIKLYPLRLGNISKDFIVNNIKKTELNRYVYDFSVDYSIINISNIINIHKYLMKKHDMKKRLD